MLAIPDDLQVRPTLVQNLLLLQCLRHDAGSSSKSSTRALGTPYIVDGQCGSHAALLGSERPKGEYDSLPAQTHTSAPTFVRKLLIRSMPSSTEMIGVNGRSGSSFRSSLFLCLATVSKPPFTCFHRVRFRQLTVVPRLRSDPSNLPRHGHARPSRSPPVCVQTLYTATVCCVHEGPKCSALQGSRLAAMARPTDTAKSADDRKEPTAWAVRTSSCICLRMNAWRLSACSSRAPRAECSESVNDKDKTPLYGWV